MVLSRPAFSSLKAALLPGPPLPGLSRVPSSQRCREDSVQCQAPGLGLARDRTAQKSELSFFKVSLNSLSVPTCPSSSHFLCLALILADPEGRAEAWGSSHGPWGPQGLCSLRTTRPKRLFGGSFRLGCGRMPLILCTGLRPQAPPPRSLAMLSSSRRPFSMCLLGSMSWVWGPGKAGCLGSHRPVAESPGGHLAPISRGGRGLCGAGLWLAGGRDEGQPVCVG